MTKTHISTVERCNILGVGVHALTIPLALECIGKAITDRTKGYICATPVHSIMLALDDSRYRRVLNQAFLCTPDGMPLVWVGRWDGHRAMERVYGPDLMRAVFAASANNGWRHYLYGSNAATLDALETRLLTAYPGVTIVGKHSPPYRPLTTSELKGLQDDVAACSPDFFWVGLGAPKQDFFMADHLSSLDTTIMIGVGAAFDFLSGGIKESPAWIRRMGLQWLHRLLTEPTRLWKRYLINNPRFVVHVLAQKMKLTLHPIPRTAASIPDASIGPAREEDDPDRLDGNS